VGVVGLSVAWGGLAEGEEMRSERGGAAQRLCLVECLRRSKGGDISPTEEAEDTAEAYLDQVPAYMF
jgi:hypothetical protein